VRTLAQQHPTVESLLKQVDASVLPAINKHIAEIVRPAQAELLDGLVKFYDQYCQPVTEKAVALVDLREDWMTFAIVQGKSPSIGRCFSLQEKPIGQSSEVSRESKLDFWFEVFEKSLEDYQATPGGKKIEVILIGGEPKCTNEFKELAQNRLAIQVKPFALGRAAVAGCYGSEHGAAQLSRAAEVGLVSKLFRG